MNTKRIGIVHLIGLTQAVVGIRQFQGSFSEGVATFAPTKSVRPSAPKIVLVQPIENAPGTIKISLELPTTNVDGSVLQQAELTRIRIYYDDESGVNEDDPFNEFPVSTTVQFAPGLSGRVYVRAKVQDSHGSWSDLSNEASAEVPEVKPFEFWAHRLGVDSIFTNNSPSAGYVSWSNVKLFFKNEGYSIQNGSTNKRYVYWRKSSPNIFQTSDTVPSLGIEDVLIGTNIDGFWYLAVYHPQVSAEFLRAGKLQSRNWSSSAGTELDLDAGTFKLGGSQSPKLSWDGTTLSIVGRVTITGGSGISNLSDAGALATRNTVGAVHIEDGAVIASKIAAGAVTAEKIAAGAVTAEKIAAGAITAEKLFVGKTPDLAPNPSFEVDSNNDGIPDQWTASKYAGDSVITLDTSDAQSGLRSLKIGNETAANRGGYVLSDYIEVTPNKTYTLSCWLKGSASTTTAYIGIQCFDSAKASLGYLYIYSNGAPGTSWVEKSGQIGPGNFPSGTRFVRIILIGKYNTNAAGYIWFDNVRFQEAISTDFLYDACITSAKIADAAITSAKIANAAIQTAHIQDAAITDAKIQNLSFSKLTAGTNYASLVIGSGGYIKSSNYSAGSSGFIIYGSGNAEFNNVTVRGQIITSSGSQLNGAYVTGTLTAVNFQTASSGQRIQIGATMSPVHTITIYNSSGYTLTSLGAGFLFLYDSSGLPGIYLYGSTGRIETVGTIRPYYTGGYGYLGDSTYYWNQVNAKDFIDRGCLGSFDDGATLPDGRKVSDVEAIKAIRVLQGEKTHYGKPRLDYSSFPVECQRPAPVAEEDTEIETKEGKKVIKKGEKLGEDGIDLSSLVALILGAIKELDSRLSRLEQALAA